MFKVLIVDDEPLVPEALRILIQWEKHGYSICGEAGNGKKAFELIVELKPDVVITDIRMPVMDGIDLIKNCMEKLTVNPKFVILSAYGDFKYAQKAMKYGVKDFLLKPVDEDELIDMLKSMRYEIERESKGRVFQVQENLIAISSHIEKILSGRGDNLCQSQINERLNFCPGEALRYVLLETSIDSRENSENLSFRNEELYSILNERFQLQVFRFTDKYTEALVKDTGTKLETVRLRFENIIYQFATYWGLKTSFMISGKIEGVLKLKDACEQMKAITTYRFYKGNKSVIFYEDVIGICLNYNFTKIFSTSALMEAIEQGDEELIKTLLEDIFKEFYKNFSAIEVIKTYINNLTVEIIKVLNDIGSDVKSFMEKYSTLADSVDKYDFRELKEAVINLCMKSVYYISSYKVDNLKGAMKDIERYIKQHYMEDINLKDISRKFFINSVYLGQQFKKCFGTYFNDYLNELRIFEAKKLLTRTNKRVYEIAQCVGYKSTDYFVGRFQKSTNMTPSEYKKQKSRDV